MSGYVLEYAIWPYEGVRNDLQKAWADPDFDTLDDKKSEAGSAFLAVGPAPGFREHLLF